MQDVHRAICRLRKVLCLVYLGAKGILVSAQLNLYNALETALRKDAGFDIASAIAGYVLNGVEYLAQLVFGRKRSFLSNRFPRSLVFRILCD